MCVSVNLKKGRMTMSSYTNRFHVVQDCASALFAEIELCRMITASDTTAGDEDLRAAAFVAAQHVRYADERVLSGLKSLRKVQDRPPVITPDDYERFIERCHGIAGALGISSDKVADTLVREAELALCHAEDALKNAHEEYAKCGKMLLFADCDAFKKEKARLVAEYLAGPKPERNPFSAALQAWVSKGVKTA